MNETSPKRRWFRFSLRGLLALVTIAGVFAGWVAHQLNWIRQRHEFIDSPTPHVQGVIQLGSDPTFHYPWVLKLFGETPIVDLLGVEANYIEQAKSLFPEATINPPDSPPPRFV
jgi:hypothetical protein